VLPSAARPYGPPYDARVSSERCDSAAFLLNPPTFIRPVHGGTARHQGLALPHDLSPILQPRSIFVARSAGYVIRDLHRPFLTLLQ